MAAATDQTAPGTTDALEDALDLDLDAGIDDELFEGYDPLEDNEFAGDEDVDYPVGDGSNLKSVPGPSVKPVAEHDERPASERTAELFSHMAARRKTLIAILRACRENAKKVAERCSWQRIGCSKDGAMRTVEDIHEEIYRRVTELLKA